VATQQFRRVDDILRSTHGYNGLQESGRLLQEMRVNLRLKPGVVFGMSLRDMVRGFRRAWARDTPGEAKEQPPSKKRVVIPGLTRNPVRQSNFCGALRRREGFWIPDQVRNDEVLGFRRTWGLASAGEGASPPPLPREGGGRLLAALRAGVQDSGFRIKSGMASDFFVSPGVGLGIARRSP
jgi:hypothetical protein